MNLGQPAPTLMYVMHDRENKALHPIVVPFMLSNYDLDSVEGYAALLIEQYPPSRFSLEMCIYARFETDFLQKGEFSVLFGGRDIGGCSIHSSYRYKRQKSHEELIHQEADKNYLDIWLQKPVIQDAFLNAAVANYFTAINMKVKLTYEQ